MTNGAVPKTETAKMRMPRPRKEDEEPEHLVLNLEREEASTSQAAIEADVASKRSGKPKKELAVEDPLPPLDQALRMKEALQIWLAKSLPVS